MTKQDNIYPGYSFKNHVGYGTAAHILAINKLGVTPLHRLSFAPLKKYRVNNNINSEFSKKRLDMSVINNLTTKQIGDNAEDVAVMFLKQKGHKVLDRNWKTKYCEIDIISKKLDVIYFTEVKYRTKSDQGGGLAAITTRKLNQMKFAAKFYALSNEIYDVNLRLSVISLSGQHPTVENLLEI